MRMWILYPHTQLALDPKQSSEHLTQVDLIFRPSKLEYWLRFGAPIDLTAIDDRCVVATFKPNQIFALVWCASRSLGTVIYRLDILRSVDRGEAYQTIPFMRPGAELLLRVESESKFGRVMKLIADIEEMGLLSHEVSPAYWRHVHNRLAADLEPHPYTRTQHKASLLRRKVKP